MSSNAEGQASSEQPQAAIRPSEEPLRAKVGPVQAERLILLAQGSSISLVLAGVLAVLTALIPLRVTNREWQMGLIGSLIANGSWLLVGLVLMHLAAMLQPRNLKLGSRLLSFRRIAALAAAGYLLLAPLQLAMTWTQLDSSRNQQQRVLTTTLRELKNWRSVIDSSSTIVEMRRRMQALPGAPEIPASADQLPLPVARRELLRQLDLAEQRVRAGANRQAEGPNRLEIWKQTLRGALVSLLLAAGFASGAEGLFGQNSLLQSLDLVRRRSLLTTIKPRKLKFKGLRKWLHWLRNRVLPRRSSIRSTRSSKRTSGLRGLRWPKSLKLWGKSKSRRVKIRVPH